jgi:hypothetical protein
MEFFDVISLLFFFGLAVLPFIMIFKKNPSGW